MSLERRFEIIEIAERFGVAIVEDNMLGPMLPDPIPPIKALAPHRTFLVSSATKILCPGLKIGFVVPPAGSHKVTQECLRAMTVRVPPLVADVFTRLMHAADLDRNLKAIRKEAQSRQELAKSLLPEEYAACHPASYYVWLSLPRPWSPQAFAEAALKKGIRVWPSDLFTPDISLAARAVRYLIGIPPNKYRLKEEVTFLAKLLRRLKPKGKTSR
jgi:DNA-binding transcriptional MocR family regulator